jgi:hypothetical protein
VRRLRGVVAAGLALVALSLVLAACSGDDDGEASTSPAASEAPNESTTPSPSGLPPELLECFADRGFELESPAEIHSAPPQVVQECFGALHQGGGAP